MLIYVYNFRSLSIPLYHFYDTNTGNLLFPQLQRCENISCISWPTILLHSAEHVFLFDCGSVNMEYVLVLWLTACRKTLHATNSQLCKMPILPEIF